MLVIIVKHKGAAASVEQQNTQLTAALTIDILLLQSFSRHCLLFEEHLLFEEVDYHIKE